MEASRDLLSRVISPSSTETEASRLLRLVAWTRVSTEMQAEKGLSLPGQMKQIELFAERNGITIVDRYSETGSASQGKSRRVVFHSMIERVVSDPEVDGIIVHDLSRFSRDLVEMNVVRRQLRSLGKEIHSVSDPAVDQMSSAATLIENIIYAKNEMYGHDLAMHTRKGCVENISKRDPETHWAYKNGGQPLWGYRSKHIDLGGAASHRNIKAIWVLDDTPFKGRPMYEWVHDCLLLAANGGTLSQMLRFCNDNGIPGRRQKFWGYSTIFALLQRSVLLKYAGYEVWDVRNKRGKEKPSEQWKVEPNAHPAILSAEEVNAILDARERPGGKKFPGAPTRSQSSPYLLSGGPFVCGRCGSRMTGLDLGKYRYYKCGSKVYRQGRGCGPGPNVRVDWIEGEVIRGLEDLFAICGPSDDFLDLVNVELKNIWRATTAPQPDTGKRIKEIDAEIANVRKAVAGGLDDMAWANGRLRELREERQGLEIVPVAATKPPRVDRDTVTAYRRQVGRILEFGDQKERKDLIAKLVHKIALAPDAGEVSILYRVPEPIMLEVVAGAGFDAIHKIFGDRLHRVLKLPRNGRRPQKLTGSTPSATKPAHAAPDASTDASGDSADAENEPIRMLAELRRLGRAA